MKLKPDFAITWGREPIDTRLGIMLGSQYDHLIVSETKAVRCIRCDFALGLLWVNVRVSLILY
jgi:hypothetical protein